MAKRRRVRGRKRPSSLGRKGTPHTVPMDTSRRLASYGVRDPNTGASTGRITPAQLKRAGKKNRHRNARARRSNA